jgi:probable rRNA maturation factor
MRAKESCTIINTTKGKLPRLPFESVKDKILGTDYELGVKFLSPKKQKEINTLYRNKNSTTNILSFSVSKTSGDLTFDLQKVKKDAKEFDMIYPKFLLYLFIHGLLHLKGMEHSSTMEKEERKYLRIFS